MLTRLDWIHGGYYRVLNPRGRIRIGCCIRRYRASIRILMLLKKSLRVEKKKVLAFRKSVFFNVRIASLVLIWRG